MSDTTIGMGPLRDTLSDLGAVVAALTPAQYRTRLSGFPSTIGAQVRHCHDHIRAFLQGAADGRIDYESRARGSAIEFERDVALSALDALRDRLALPAAKRAEEIVTIVDRVDASRSPAELISTIGRELHFVTSHTIHHGALIGAMAGAFGVSSPRGFGFAFSTLAYIDRSACAR